MTCFSHSSQMVLSVLLRSNFARLPKHPFIRNNTRDKESDSHKKLLLKKESLRNSKKIHLEPIHVRRISEVKKYFNVSCQYFLFLSKLFSWIFQQNNKRMFQWLSKTVFKVSKNHEGNGNFVMGSTSRVCKDSERVKKECFLVGIDDAHEIFQVTHVTSLTKEAFCLNKGF